LRLKLVKFFAWKGCPDADTNADETLDRVARRLAEGVAIQNLSAYAYQVARYILLEEYRQAETERAAIIEPTEPEPQSTRMLCLEECLAGLPDGDRDLILSYYEGEGGAKIENRKTLAQSLRISLTALKIRACRLRAKLESCINSCVARQ
jgi:DNA-directed RNA polymerase specialized sigma24 family protein